MKKYTRSALLFLAGLSLGIAGTGLAAAVLGSSIFPDVRRGAYYDEAVGELHEMGIIQGYSDGRFGPDDFVTRGQVAVLLKRLHDELKSEEPGQVSEAASSTLAASVAQTGGAGSIRFTIDKYRVDEGEGMAQISIIRTGGNQGEVSVGYSVSDGTAKAGEDYEAVSGTLRFADGETNKIFVVRIMDDDLNEGDEMLNLALGNPTGGAKTTLPDSAVLTIVDDDTVQSAPITGDTFSFSALKYDVSEAGDTIAITVERGGDASGAATVDYATSDETATSVHYIQASGTLSFADGQKSKAFSVDVNDNDLIGGNKTVKLRLSNPTGGMVLGDVKEAQLIIADDEVTTFGTGSLKFARATFEAMESDGKAVIEVMRVGGAKGTVTVDYATSAGTAVPPADYTEVSGTITFLAGESKKAFIVPIVDDEQNDSGEKVTLTLSNPTGGAKLASPSTATLEIQ